MRRRRQHHNPVLEVLFLHHRKELLDQVEVAEHIDSQLLLEPIGGFLSRGQSHDACVAHQEVDSLLGGEDI